MVISEWLVLVEDGRLVTLILIKGSVSSRLSICREFPHKFVSEKVTSQL